MKKIFKILTVLILVFSLAGCSLLEDELSLSNNNLGEELDKVYNLVNDVSYLAMKANVKIITTSYTSSFFFPEKISGQGSGVIFSEDLYYYYILTNNHVVNKDEEYTSARYQVTDYMGEKYNASLIASSAAYDLGLLKMPKSKSILEVLSFSSKELAKNDLVIAIGQPKGQNNTITLGKFTKFTNGNLEETNSHVDFEVIEHTAPINRGSSGGVLINKDLEIVGINYAGSFTEGVEASVFAYAIPVLKINEFLTINNIK